MDTDKIIQDLNRRFAVFLPEFYQRRIIFWYDEDKEFEDKLDEVVGSLTVGYREFDSWISEKSTCRSHKTCFFCVKFLVFIYCILLQCVVRYNKGGILHASYYIEI